MSNKKTEDPKVKKSMLKANTSSFNIYNIIYLVLFVIKGKRLPKKDYR